MTAVWCWVIVASVRVGRSIVVAGWVALWVISMVGIGIRWVVSCWMIITIVAWVWFIVVGRVVMIVVSWRFIVEMFITVSRWRVVARRLICCLSTTNTSLTAVL